MQKKYLGLILAGGQGTRFWPWSTEDVPKQFLNIIGKEPLILQTFNRLKNFIPPENIYVVADIKYFVMVMELLPEFRQLNFISEPSPRNTAPSLILANLYLSRINPDANVVVVPSDHYIEGDDIFATQLQNAMSFADNRYIITCGIKPDMPHTGYGYIQFKENGSSMLGQTDFYDVEEFKEKPEREVAEEYLEKGNYYWNSGMFIYKVKYFKEFLGEYSPYYFIQYTELQKVFHHKLSFYELFNTIEPESIDYALMENVKEVKMFKAGFQWSDLGAWSSVYDMNPKDPSNNVTQKKNNIFIDSENSMIFSTDDKPVAAIGLKNIAVINTENGILVADMKELQKVKTVIRKLGDR